MLNSLIDIGDKNFIFKEDIIAVLDWEALNSSKIGRDFLKEIRINYPTVQVKKQRPMCLYIVVILKYMNLLYRQVL